MHKSTISGAEALIVTVICFGFFIGWSVEAAFSGFPESRFTDSGNLWLVGVEVTLGIAALLYLRARRFDTASLYPEPTLRGSLAGVAAFVASWVAGYVAVSLFYTPGRSQMTEFSFAGVSLASVIVLAIVNGAYEEVFLLGVLTRGLRGFGLSVAVGVPLLIRALYHLYQGPLGVVWVLVIGLTLTFTYVQSQKLWPPVLAHILWDIVPVVVGGA